MKTDLHLQTPDREAWPGPGPRSRLAAPPLADFPAPPTATATPII